MGLITAPSDARTAGTLTQTLQLSAATADMSQCPWYTAEPELVLVLMMTARPSCQLTLSASHLGSAINPPPDINLFQLFTGWQNKHGIPVMEVV